jgi:RimJ/RimL family protein N-acetyltransferase
MPPEIIESARLRLVIMTPAFMEASLAGKGEKVEPMLGTRPHPEWLAARDLIEIRLAQLQQDPTLQPWLLRAIIRRDEPTMIGHIGFHTKPAPDYLRDYAPQGVELGYTIYTPFRRQGYASEALAAMMDWAVAKHQVPQFVLTISPENAPSLRMAERFGFVKVGSHVDPDDGLEYIFVRNAAADPLM